MKSLPLVVALSCALASPLAQAQTAPYELKQYVPGLRVTGAAQETSKTAPTLGPWGPFEGTVGDSLQLTAPISDSPGAWTFSSSNPSVAKVIGATLTWLSAGTATLTAEQASTADYASASRTASLLSNPAATEPVVNDVTGYWSLRVDFAGSSYIGVPAPSVTSLGYTATCSGTVATGGSTHVWASTASLSNTDNWPGQSRVLCVPASASDVQAFSSLSTYASESGGWLK